MKLRTLLFVALIAVVVAGCTTYPPNGTAITLTYPDGQTPGEEAADDAFSDTESRGTGTTTVRGLRVLNNASIGDALTVGGNMVLTGPTVAATATPAAIVNNLGAANVSFEVRDAATPVFQVLNGGNVAAGVVSAKAPILVKTANYTALTTDTGAVINTTNAMTVTLPAVVAGLAYCVYNGDGNDIKIDPSGTNTILTLTNGNGDRLTNTTIGDSVCLVGLNTSSWMALERVGTWSDGN